MSEQHAHDSAPAAAAAVGAAAAGQQDADQAEVFVLELVQALHRHGLPAYRIEDAMARVGERLGLELHVFSVPTGLTLGIGPVAAQHVRLLRVQPGTIYLARISELVEVIEAVVEGHLTLPQASAALAEIERRPPIHRPMTVAAAFALASAASAVFFGAHLAEVLVSGAIGGIVGLLGIEVGRRNRLSRLLEVLGAAAAAALAGVAAALPLALERDLVTLAAIIVLLPGYTLTIAMNELAVGHYSSGTARLGSALSTLCLLACGAALGAAAADIALAHLPLADLRRADAPPLRPELLPPWAIYAALLWAPLAYKVLFQARHRDTLWIVGAAALAFLGAGAGTRFLGPLLGPGCGAFALGLASNALARVRLRPGSVTAVPGLLVLVPGSIGFRGMHSLLAEDAFSGLELATRMLAVAVSLVCGLLLATVVLPPQRTL